MIVHALRLLGAILTLAFVACLLYLTTAFVLGYATVNRDFHPTPGGTEVFVCSNGAHTDFVLPVTSPVIDWSAKFPPEDFAAPVSLYDHIGLGWGDLEFYRTTPRWEDLKLGTALHALLGLGPSAIHAQYRPAPLPGERCAGVAISDAEYRTLADYITGSLVPSPAAGQARAVIAGEGYGASDRFYRARGRFSLVNSCNVWVDEGLKAAGLPSGVWTPFAFLVMAHF
ncbi:MAG TPA: TIGR02117 family protein [Candidatus Cybelea sp.]|nr:TIGR02117 family protein [Candidatus Cybelea sp.]